jgi:hypothetical protein
MATNPYYYQVERGVLGHVNALRSDLVATGETNYRANAMTPDTVIKNPMFPPTLVRVEIVNMERVIADLICSTDGHPRRVDFLVVVSVANGAPLPSSVGGIGAVYRQTETEPLYYLNRPIDVVQAMRAEDEQILVTAAPVREDRIWGWDGATFFATTDDVLKMETFDYDVPYNTFAELDIFFDPTRPTPPGPNRSKLAPEFQEAWEAGAAAVLAAKVGTFPREASDYWQKFTTLMQMQGVQVSIDLDHASRESK